MASLLRLWLPRSRPPTERKKGLAASPPDFCSPPLSRVRTMIELLQEGLLIALCVAGGWWDARFRRIPNVLTVPSFCVALSLSAAAGSGVLLSSLVLVVATLMFGSLGFSRGILGGGDVKMLLVVSAILAPQQMAVALLLTGVAGGALAIGLAFRRGILLPVLYDCGDLLLSCLTAGRPRAAPTRTAVSVPYGVAIAIGAVGGSLL